MIEENPEVSQFELQSAKVIHSIGQLAQQRQDWSSALSAFQRVIEIVKQLPPEEQSGQDVRQLRIKAHKVRSDIFAYHAASPPNDDGTSRFLSAASEVEQLLALDPDTDNQKRRLYLAVYYAWASDYRRAAPLAERLIPEVAGDGESVFNLACVFSRCAEAVFTKPGDSLSPEQQAELKDRYTAQALQLLGDRPTLDFLRAQLQSGKRLLDSDPDLKWLRDTRSVEIQALRNKVSTVEKVSKRRLTANAGESFVQTLS